MVDFDWKPGVPSTFESLGDKFFSLGQSQTYYEELFKLEAKDRVEISSALRDVVFDDELLDAALNEYVMKKSLMRDIAVTTIVGQFRRVALGDERLLRFDFTYVPRDSETKLRFSVNPTSTPPSNVHVLIGRNGVGKTFLINDMIQCLLQDDGTRKNGSFSYKQGSSKHDRLFARVCTVSFSAFDNIPRFRESSRSSDSTPVSYIGLYDEGLRNKPGSKPRTTHELAQDFSQSLDNISKDERLQRWQAALRILRSDPIFREIDFSPFAEQRSMPEKMLDLAQGLFSSLSSGHKVILLAITKLVEIVEERTLLFFDEPEAHLHPPLLSSFVTAISNLLIGQNGIAIIATHSPVVLQEVPRLCSWKLSRVDTEFIAIRPELETFGENVGVLTREVFALEVTESGFYSLIRQHVRNDSTFENVLKVFDGQVGGEGRALIRALIAEAKVVD